MKELFADLCKRARFTRRLAVVFPDGSSFSSGEPAELTLQFKTDFALRDCLTRGSLGFGEAYMRGEIEIAGPMTYVAELGIGLKEAGLRVSGWAKLKVLLGQWLRANTLRGARRNVSYHYDAGNDFYKLWLDEEMVYSCAYFHDRSDTLEQAQRQKLDLICRKLRLTAGETLLDCGCGWGELAFHAARQYGVRVVGYTISEEQHAYCQQKAERLNLSRDSVEFVLADYRTIADRHLRFDKFASVGMLEHVGRKQIPTFFRIMHGALAPGGVALVQSVSRTNERPPDPFSEKHVFPGFYVPPLAEMVTAIQNVDRGLHVVDVENLRAHYALTLDHWSRRFQANRHRIAQAYGEPFTRMYELYLGTSSVWFRQDGLLVFQLLISKGFDEQAPLTRSSLMEPPPAAGPPSDRRGSRIA